MQMCISNGYFQHLFMTILYFIGLKVVYNSNQNKLFNKIRHHADEIAMLKAVKT